MSRVAIHRAVVITALGVEFQAVLAHLSDVREEVHRAETVYHVGILREGEVQWDIILLEIGPGNAGAAIETERAVQQYHPEGVLFVGVAGGIKDVRIGDVVAATKVYGYHSGKAKAEFEARPDVGWSDHGLVQRARAVRSSGRWTRRIPGGSPDPAPAAYVEPIAAGEAVVAARRSAIFKFLRQAYGDAVAVEMEGRGFLEAVHRNLGVRALVVRGISDLVSGKRGADAAGAQVVASRHAAAFAVDVLLGFAAANPADGRPRHRDPLAPVRPRGHFDLSAYSAAMRGRLASGRDWYVELAALSSAPAASRVPNAEFNLQVGAGSGSPTLPLQSWMAEVHRGLLVGPLGSGKSTALERAALGFLDAGQTPILVPLRDSTEAGCMPLVQRALSIGGPTVTRSDVEGLLSAPGSVVLFDGLNESPADVRDAVWADLRRFLATYPATRIVLTSRDGDLASAAGLNMVSIQPLDAGEQLRFAKLHIGDDAGLRLIARLHRRTPVLSELAERPLFLKMLVDVFDESRDVPHSAGVLLQRFFEHVLGAREHERGAVYTERELTAVLGPVALEILERGRLWLTSAELTTTIDRVCRGLLERPTFFSLRAALTRRPIEAELETRGLLIVETGRARFPHPAIGDYFAARRLAEEFAATSTLRVPASEPQYAQILRFLLDLLAPDTGQLQALMDQLLPASLDGFCHGAALLAATAFDEAFSHPTGGTRVDPGAWICAVHAAYLADGAVLREVWRIPVPEAERVLLVGSDQDENLLALLLTTGANGRDKGVGGLSVNRAELGHWPPRLAALQLLAARARWRRTGRTGYSDATSVLADLGWTTHLTLLERARTHAQGW
jgi:nucleoside phosphorylase